MKIWSVRLIRWIVGGVLLYAGWLKARDPGTLITDIWNYRLIPEDLAYWIAAGLPYLEMVCGLALIIGTQCRGAHLLAGLLFLGFSLALGSAWWRGLDINCGCFGGASSTTANYPLTLARNGLLLAAIIWSANELRRRP